MSEAGGHKRRSRCDSCVSRCGGSRDRSSVSRYTPPMDESRRDPRKRSRRGDSESRRSPRCSRDRSPERRCEHSRDPSRDRSRSPSEPRRPSAEGSATVETLRKTVEKLQEELRATRYRPTIVQEHLVPRFDPADDKADIELWVRDVDRIARRGGWCDDDIVCSIARQLRGHARRLFDDEQRRDSTWETLKAALIARFKTPLPFNRLLREAASYTAIPGQKLGDYCFAKLAKLRALKIEIPDEFLRDAIIGSIGDEAIERTIRSNKYATVDDLYVAMREMGRVGL